MPASKKDSTGLPQAPTRLTASQAARYAGVGESSIRRAWKRGDLVGRRPRGQAWPVLFKPEDIDRWMDGLAPLEGEVA